MPQSVIKSEYRLFFGLTTCLTESLVSWFIMKANFCACPALSMEVKNTSGKAKVVVSNLTRNFLKTGIIPVQKMSAYSSSAYVLSA